MPQSSPSALFAVKSEDKSTLANYFTIPQFRSQLPADLRYAKFAFGLPVVNKLNGIETVDVYALAGNRENKPQLSGAVITNQSYNQVGEPSVSMQMNGKGAKIWEEMTGKAYNQQSQITVVLDNVVYSTGVTSGPIWVATLKFLGHSLLMKLLI